MATAQDAIEVLHNQARQLAALAERKEQNGDHTTASELVAIMHALIRGARSLEETPQGSVAAA